MYDLKFLGFHSADFLNELTEATQPWLSSILHIWRETAFFRGTGWKNANPLDFSLFEVWKAVLPQYSLGESKWAAETIVLLPIYIFLVFCFIIFWTLVRYQVETSKSLEGIR